MKSSSFIQRRLRLGSIGKISHANATHSRTSPLAAKMASQARTIIARNVRKKCGLNPAGTTTRYKLNRTILGALRKAVLHGKGDETAADTPSAQDRRTNQNTATAPYVAIAAARTDREYAG